LFPFKDINWQKQLDNHFLILQTGGGAAKILNTSSGMEDQETLMKVVKSDISEHKSNIKRLVENNKEYDVIITKLKPVTRLLMNAKAINQFKIHSIELNNEIVNLNKLIIDIEHHKIDKQVFDTIRDLNIRMTNLKNQHKESIKLNQSIKQINNLIIQLNKIEKVTGKSAICNKLIHSINSINDKSKESYYLQLTIKQISNTITQIRKTIDNQKHFKIQLEQLENKFNQILWVAGECPLCGTLFNKKGHIC